MAWSTINHICGHTSTVQLYGPSKDRERTVAYRSTQNCPSCWAEAKREADKQAGPLVTIRVFGEGEKRSIEFVFTRSTYDIKDTLKARGYRFGEYTTTQGFLDLMARPDKGWAKAIRIADRQAADAEVAWLTEQITLHKWEARIQDQMATLLASLTEGRAVLAGL